MSVFRASSLPRYAIAAEVGVVVVHWRSPQLLDHALTSLELLDDAATRIVVVVDNNSGLPFRWWESFNDSHPEALIVLNSSNDGFARATNLGATLVDVEAIMTVNPDAVVLPGSLDAALSLVRSRPDIAVMGPLQTAIRFWRIQPPRPFLAAAERWSAPRRVNYLQGTGLVIRPSALLGAQVFAEDLFLFGEELELCARVRRSGYSITSSPELMVRHSQTHKSYETNEAHREAARRLLWSAQWLRRSQYFGRVWAQLSEVVSLIDAISLLVLGRRARRDEAVRAFLRSRASCSTRLLLFGARYVRRVHVEARSTLV